MQRLAKNFIFAAILLAGLVMSAGGFAQLQPKVKASIIRDFARVSFSAQSAPKLRSAVKGRQIRLRFDQAVTVSSAPLLKKLKPYVISVSQSSDKRSLLLTTNREYRIRSFVSGKASGIDIIGLQKGGIKTPPKAESVKPKPKPKPVAKKLVQEIANAQEAMPKLPLTVKPNAKPDLPKPVVSEEKPIAPEPEAKPEPKPSEPVVAKKIEQPVEVKPEETPQKPEEAPKPTPETEAPPPAAEPVPEAAPEKALPPKAEPAGETVEIIEQPVQQAAPVAPVTMAQGKITTENLEDGIALIFPWDKRVAMAAIRRDERTLIIFNAIGEFDAASALADDRITQISSHLGEGEDPAQIWEIHTPLDGVNVIKDKKSYAWRVELIEDSLLPDEMFKPQSRVEPPLKPHLFIPALQMSAPVKLTDPLIGDALTAVPFYEASMGLVPPRRFAEFFLPRSAQGLVVTDAMPELRVVRTRNGIKITAPGGILLSKDLPPVPLPEEAVEDSEASNSFFPYQNWQVPLDEEDARVFENKLWQQASGLHKKKKRKARKRLIELYLAQGKAAEAKSLLRTLAQESPIYFTRNKLYALFGAAHFLAYEFPQADTAFKHPTIAEEKELWLWRDILNIALRGDGKADYLGYHDEYIRHYSPMMRQRLALIAADHQINRKKYNKALQIFDTLHKNAMLEEVYDQVRFLIGRVLAGTTQKDAARKTWNRLIAESNNNYVRPRAKFALINLDLAENKISIEEAIQKLEPLRVSWRGDSFEITLLMLMAKLYEEKGDYREALRAYREIVTYFPNHPENLELTGKMADIFKKLFNEGGADSLSPLQALALYYEFRNLTPIGEAGDQMIQNLADRLAAIDLLDRAAALLQHQVKFRLSGETRSRVGARLALVHLLHRKPQEALDVLELTGYGGNPFSLRKQRALLTARALADLNQKDRAIALLKGDESREAQLLELNLYWNAQEWPKVIKTAEKLLGQRDDPSLPLDDSESVILMKLAIAYAFEQQRGQLQYLRDYFLPLVADEDSKKLFAFITEDTPVDQKNIAKLAAQIGRMESFLASYRNKMKEGGLSKAVE